MSLTPGQPVIVVGGWVVEVDWPPPGHPFKYPPRSKEDAQKLFDQCNIDFAQMKQKYPKTAPTIRMYQVPPD